MDVGEAAALGLLVQYAMDSFTADPANIAPPADPRLSPQWKLLGHLTAFDAVFRKGPLNFGNAVCYGFLAQSTTDPTSFAVAIRGTAGTLEWLDDAEFLPVQHPIAGTVEAGFWGIYQSMEFQPLGGTLRPAPAGIAAAVGQGSIVVIGHSLGAPLATYLAFDLSAAGLLGDRVQAILFASPRPGDSQFGAAFATSVKRYQLFNYDLDIVPRVPLGNSYTDLPGAVWIDPDTAQCKVGFSLFCHHHLLCYLAMLDYALMNWQATPVCDYQYTVCIKGKTP
jgi:hypothetical protein